MKKLLLTFLLACSSPEIPPITDIPISAIDAGVDQNNNYCELFAVKKDLQKLYSNYKDCLECAVKYGTPALCGSEFIMEWICGEYTKIMFTNNSNIYANYIFKGDTWVYGEHTNSGKIICTQGKMPECSSWTAPIILCR